MRAHNDIRSDATWNFALDPLRIIRIIYLQLAALTLAVLALLLTIFSSETSKRVRGTILIIGGILGAASPASFIYQGIYQVQQASAQWQWTIGFIKALNVQLQYNFTPGSGLTLAILGPVLLLIGGIIVFRHKK